MVRALLIGCIAGLLIPGAAAASTVDLFSMNPQARRAALRQAHRQTVLTTQGGGNPHMYQHWLDRAAVPTAKGHVIVTNDPGAALGGGTSRTQPDGDVIGLSSTAGPSTFLHEMGHAFDRANLTDDMRRKIQVWLGDRRPWGDQGAAYAGEPNAPREKFAEVYRVLAQHPTAVNSQQAWQHFLQVNGGIAYTSKQPTFFQMRKIRQVIQQAAAR